MKYVFTSDWHIRSTVPRIRKDDYPETQFKKAEWILNFAEEKNADVVIAGDITHGPRCPFWLLNRYIKLFIGFKNNIFVIPGQHDVHNHLPDVSNTPLGVLYQSGAVLFPDDDDIRGIGWEGKMPDKWSEILAIHECITPDTPPFYLKDAISAEDAIEKYGHITDVIVSGDYHQHHVTITEDKILCNPGPIMRASKDKMNYDPCVFLYDDGMIEMIPIPNEKDVFDEEALKDDERKEYSDELKELVEALTMKGDVVDFIKAMEAVAKAMEVSKGAQKVLNQIKENFNG